MLRVILRINQVHLVRDLAGLVKNKTKDGLSDGSIIFNNVKNPIKQTIIKIDGAPGGSRTPDQQDRNLLLYPAELLAHLHRPEERLG